MRALNKDMPSHMVYCVRVICEEDVQHYYFKSRQAANDFIDDFDEAELKYLDVQYMGIVYIPNYINQRKAMINYIKDLFTEIRPEIKGVAERIKEGYTEYNFLMGLHEYKIASLGVSFYFHNNKVYDFSVNYYDFPLTNKEKRFLSKAVQQLEKQREDEKTQKAYSLLKSNLEKK